MKGLSTELMIIKALKEVEGSYISGEELAQRASVSRAAVWKHIKTLRDKGYGIEAIPKVGYKLVRSPDAILPEEIIPILKTRSFGRQIIYRRILGSTNDLAKKLAEKGASEGTVIIAEEQSKGKGRLNRSWTSPPGGIWLSAILRPEVLLAEASRFTILAAVAVAKAMEKLGVQPDIKWPNDILIEGRKVCGVLLELSSQIGQVDYLVMGFGVNANFKLDAIPSDFRDNVTTLYEVLGRKINRSFFISELLYELEDSYRRLLAGGWKSILADWLKRCKMLNQSISLQTIRGTVEGEFIGVDDLGAIRIKLPGGRIKKFAAGDVTIKKRLT
ncbi:MAG: biotin--[acetyl-CoA-carboxylase] ligase [Actinomycetota bacterium]